MGKNALFYDEPNGAEEIVKGQRERERNKERAPDEIKRIT